jgi:hypothetical protein
MNKNSNSININTTGNKTKMEISSVVREKIYPGHTNKNIREKKIEEGIGATLTKFVINNNEYIIYNSNPPAFIYQQDFLNNISLPTIIKLTGEIVDDRKVNLIYISSNRINYKHIKKTNTNERNTNTQKFYKDILYLEHNINYFNLNSIMIVSNKNKNTVIRNIIDKINIVLELYNKGNVNKEESIEKLNEIFTKFIHSINFIVNYEYLIDYKILSDFYEKFNILQNRIKKLLTNKLIQTLKLLENENNILKLDQIMIEFKSCIKDINNYKYLIDDNILLEFNKKYILLKERLTNPKLANNRIRNNNQLIKTIIPIKTNNLNKKKQSQKMNLPIRGQRQFIRYPTQGIISH